MTRLIEQVNNFQEIIKNNKDFFVKLLELHGCIWDGNEKSIKKILVWPCNENGRKDNSTVLKNNEILEYCYNKGDTNFTISKVSQ
jgi:hypothetical protein